MARITPGSASSLDLDQIEEHEPYKGTLKKIDITIGSAEYGSKKQLTLDWELENSDPVRDWIGLTLTPQNDGTSSKLTQLLNALSDKPADTAVAWFDPDTLEWSYVKDGAPFNKLAVGNAVVFRGKIGKKADGNRKFTINVYQAPKPPKASAAKNSGKLKPATEDEVPF